jgi:serine protease Do
MNKGSANLLITVVLLALFAGGVAGAWFGAYYANQFLVATGLARDNFQTWPNAKLATPTEPSATVQPVLTTEAAVAKVTPAVVSVAVMKEMPVYETYYTTPNSGSVSGDYSEQNLKIQVEQRRQVGTEQQEVGSGSGFVVSRDGLILTNKHVVSDQTAEYLVVANDGKKYPAKVLARDAVLDVAFLKIEANNLPVARLGNSDNLQLGQTVIAIGNALGEFNNTVSQGIISGLSRQVMAGAADLTEQLSGVIQTDTAINLGNSGGPLINLAGEVVGMNTAMASGAQSIAFAIPANDLRKLVMSVKQTGRIIRPFLGVRYTLIDEQLKKAEKLTVDYGALLVAGENSTESAILPGSPAAQVGLQEKDIILEADGKKINQDYPLSKALLNRNVGDQISLKVLSNGQEKIVKVKLVERPE